ncbi:MAG: AAA family ATPase [Limnoraphis sp. WC205]|nr:AAA family ATPase [Limnoraphis sp. WC205]
MNRPQIPGYQIIEQLHNGSRTLVYRGIKNSNDQPVVLKVLRNPYPSFSDLVQFKNQYTITHNLVDIPNIIKPYSLEPYKNGYVLVMEDFGGISLSQYIQTKPLTVGQFLPIAIQIVETLHQLQGARVIHKDLKPANILINPTNLEIKIIDFSISSLLPKETQEIHNPNILEGTLAYLSPEQTGRMNRGIDYRSDFYSLGVTFYQLLSGKLPFTTDDPMELVHCHIAKLPPCLQQLNPEIPSVLSDIVMKLMAKNAEDRYQSALGLKQDLETCWHQLQSTGEIASFPIAQRDLSDRFMIPEKLYGRKTEVETLLNAFERVSNPPEGRAELMLVAGFSGIGKTAVINEVHKPIVRKRGCFIKGKYDQFNRNIPFSAFVQAFRDLIGQLLTESDLKLQQWKAKILQALGENGQVIIDVIPELELLIGKQPAIVELSGSAAQNRFNLFFQKFVKVFTSVEHQLVIFLDDLQWSDSASLKLLQLLMNDAGHLLILGAYRDNEVSPVHPFILAVNELKKTGVTVNTITLNPLSQRDINQLIADTLSCELALAQPLTELVYQKTLGNPFFTTQFLKALYDDQLIKFNLDAGYWQCDISKVKAQSLTNDVVEFMALQLQKLPTETQNILKLAACIGAQFDLQTLAIVSEQSEVETATHLWRALQEGLIVPINESYKFFQEETEMQPIDQTITVPYRFLHDRIQQAAYSLILYHQKQHTHYRIGKLLLQQICPETREERIFELVNQLNYGTSLITEPTERDELARLNLTACRKARTATAYQAAREYAQIGLNLLGSEAWQRHYQMTLALHELAAEIASLCGDFEEMETFINLVIEQAHSLLEQVNVYRIKVQSNVSRNQSASAVAIALPLLEQLGVTFPKTPTQNDIEQSFQEITELIGNREIEDLVNLSVMTDVEKLAIIQIASSIMAAAYISGSPLYPLLVSLCVKLSIQYGNTSASAFGYTSYSIILCNLFQDVNNATKFSQLALKVIAKFNIKSVKPEVFNVVGTFMLHRTVHIKETLPFLQDSYTIGVEVGYLEYAGYSASTVCNYSFWCSQPLGILQQETRTYTQGLAQLNQLTSANYCRITWQAILNLLEGDEHPEILSGEAIQETEFLSVLLSNNDLYGVYLFYLYKLTFCFWFREIEQAENYTTEFRKYLQVGAGTFGEAVFYFYDSLIALAQLRQPLNEESEALQRVEQNQIQLQHWADYASMNHQHKVDLVAAEKCRVLGQKLEAIDLYDQAISGAKENEYIQEEALANELAAKFYLDWGKEKVASAYLQEAYYCYSYWGAKAKIEDLEKRYPQLITAIWQIQQNRFHPGEGCTSTVKQSDFLNQTIQTNLSTNNSNFLDFATILKASQALSSEIQLEQLFSTLVQVVMENAGADKCVLILLKGNNLVIEATAFLRGENTEIKSLVLESLPIESSPDIPLSLINYVSRTQETLVIDDASTQTSFASDAYIQQQRPKSLLCVPIINSRKLIGIVYLENNLTPGVFTHSRLEILKVLTTQAAISLENANLYNKLEEYSYTLEHKVEERTLELRTKATQLETTLQKLYSTQSQLIQTEKMSSLGQLVAGIAHEINNPVNFIYGNLTYANEYLTSLIELINLYQEIYPQPQPEILAKIEEIDLEFMLNDLPKLLASMKIGSDRICKIVNSLQNFSRLDEAKIKPVDIHSGIDSTLLILQHRLKANDKYPEITLIKEYGKLPLVKCYISALNQVFMNIISNAIDALRQAQENCSDGHQKPTIIIRTLINEARNVVISIADNGPGMENSVLNKIFDPFFTTKPVGSGTGLGLSISYSIIVEKHQGQLSCISVPGEGAEFLIEIPL